MTYPDPVYFGDKGEINATYRPAAHEPELTYRSGNTVHYLATGASTNGRFGLYRWEMGPEPSGPDQHFHRSISESFFTLTGTIRIYDGNRWIDTRPGDFVHVPEGGIHAFRNESGEPASMLLHFAPGAPREGYFEGLAEFAVSGRPSDEELAAFYFRHDTFWL
ncbi:cupin domain-containing protein [Streptosporangium sp. 'caverna']|uniref:cupin domain-containing protein n=1 Tax=Streptosporangium sp. 'caverna' TaxID=2202249 RepID=UPI000D7EAC07|nr:cupin domain-containing protein [Streptosporangium sp. 'caverna']AWS41736.1 cupin [Streptosporangium sp. 'caverna']